MRLKLGEVLFFFLSPSPSFVRNLLFTESIHKIGTADLKKQEKEKRTNGSAGGKVNLIVQNASGTQGTKKKKTEK